MEHHGGNSEHGNMLGHVVPGLFYLVTGLVLVFVARSNYRAYLSGPTRFKTSFGVIVFGMSGVGILIEGFGGMLFIGDFLFQLAHETMYAAFLLVGLAALLESTSRVPFESWRFVMAIALLVEGMVFYGHALEQSAPEDELHLVMALYSILASAVFLLSAVYPNNVDLHILGSSGVVLKGVWFIVIAHILYSGVYGMNGAKMTVANVYVYAGLSILFVLSIIGSLMYCRRSGGYELIEEVEKQRNQL